MTKTAPSRDYATPALVTCGGLSVLIYLALLRLSESFVQDVPQLERPLFLVVALFVSATCVYLAAIRFAIQCDRTVTRWVIGFAIAFRAVMFFSEPIQEVDIYRYLWDGLVSTQGVSPFAYAPQVVAESLPSDELPTDLQRLVRLRLRSSGIQETLGRVHYADLPTVYPPVSQVVFAAVGRFTPDTASVRSRVLAMKAVLLGFDLATILVVLATMRQANIHPGWSLTYAWCPLVLKEFANSGHLDTIAVFFSAAAVHCAVMGFFPRSQKSLHADVWLVAGGALLGLAVGAKLYPLALVPILAWSCLHRRGWRKTAEAAFVFTLTCSICLAPMLWPIDNSSSPPAQTAKAVLVKSQVPDRQAGLKAFLSHWMMNDLIFLSISENLTAESQRVGPRPWFVVLPDSLRTRLGESVSQTFGVDPSRVAFMTARCTTAILFLALAGYFAGRAAWAADPQQWLEQVFLTMAWFWLLLPTLNPWYWIWTLPWIAYARNRIWLALSGLLFIYYLRFYFDAATELRFGRYQGAEIFDYVIVWFEYVPWFASLIAWRLWNSRRVAAEDQ